MTNIMLFTGPILYKKTNKKYRFAISTIVFDINNIVYAENDKMRDAKIYL